ncbi:MAG TPA: mechanosensitive ion channel domain-containing protein [Balneolaceae bacterium]|nr:mechanosensitive ion channel domain-containing protein [Balneolaceae bacterium]
MSWAKLGIYLKDILDYTLFKINGTPVTVISLIIFILFVGVFVFLGVLLRKFLNRRLFKRLRVDAGTSYTLSRIAEYFIFTIGILLAFQFVGIDLSGLAVIFGMLSVGIGFGLQNVTSNFISGLIILFERPIRVGDRVVVDQVEGDVTEINIRSTKVRTVNNILIIVPNSVFVSQNVTNYSHSDPTYRLDINVGVSYNSDLSAVLKAMNEVAEENENVLAHPKWEVHLVEFGDSAWNMQLRAWIGNVKNYPRVRNELNQEIVRKFNAFGVEIPFPQRDLHVRSSVDLPVLHKPDNSENKAK